MSNFNLFANIIIYFIVTAFFVWLIVFEKKIGQAIKTKRDKFAEKTIQILKLKSRVFQSLIKKFIDISEALITAIILVLIIQHFYVGNFLVPTGSMEPDIMPGDRMFANMVEYKFLNPKRGDVIVFREPLTNRLYFTKRIIGLPGDSIHVGDNGAIFINGKKLMGEKFNRKYYQQGLLQNDTWVIPKKGDLLTLKNGQLLINKKRVQIKDFKLFQAQVSKRPGIVTNVLQTGTYVLNNTKKTGPLLDLVYNKDTLKQLLSGKAVKLQQNYYFVMGDNSDESLDSRFWGFVAQNRIKGKIMVRFWPLNRMGMVK